MEREPYGAGPEMKPDLSTAGRDLPRSSARLEITEASLQLDARLVLERINLDLSFRRLGIVGRNGSGKSTLLRLVAGLVAPSAGQCRLNGTDVLSDRRAALREVGILFQNPDHQIIFPTVLEEIVFGLRQLGRSKRAAQDEARATLARFGKSDWADVFVSTLSQGQKHLVCLMSVVAMAPRTLLLDEPFAGLDIPTKAQLTRYLGLFQGAVIHVSHDPADLAGYETVLWLEKGRIAALGDGAAVLGGYLDEMARQGEGDDISHLAG